MPKSGKRRLREATERFCKEDPIRFAALKAQCKVLANRIRETGNYGK